MVIARIPAREHDIRAAHLAAVCHREAENAGIEVLHPGHVVHVNADVAHAQRHRAGFVGRAHGCLRHGASPFSSLRGR